MFILISHKSCNNQCTAYPKTRQNFDCINVLKIVLRDNINGSDFCVGVVMPYKVFQSSCSRHYTSYSIAWFGKCWVILPIINTNNTMFRIFQGPGKRRSGLFTKDIWKEIFNLFFPVDWINLFLFGQSIESESQENPGP